MNLYKTLGIILMVSVTAGCGKFNIFGGPGNTDNWTAQQYYQEAKRQLEKENYSQAARLYQELEAFFPFGRYAEQAQLEVGYAFFKDDEPEAALASADRFIRLHPTHPNVDYAYYLKGLVNFSTENSFVDKLISGEFSPDRDPRSMLDSYGAFRDLITRFPNSRYIGDAEKRLTFLFNNLAMHEVHVADYYLRRGAYVAVVNRSKHILEQFQRTPATEHALGMMAVAYKEMGMDDLAEDAHRVLALNFPQSEYLSGRRQAIKGKFSIIPWLN